MPGQALADAARAAQAKLEAPAPMTLIIQLNPDGSVGVRGPLGDKPICYAMLEMAKDAIRDYNNSEKTKLDQSPQIVMASNIPNLLH